MRSTVAVVLLFMLVTVVTYGQDENNTSVLVYGTLSLPTGNFSENIGAFTGKTRRAGYSIGDEVGLAEIGFGLGAELGIKTGISGLSWIFGVSALSNGVNSNTVQTKFQTDASDTIAVSSKFGRWTNIPIMSGLRYDFNLSYNIGIYGIVMGGINFSWRPYKSVTENFLTVDTVGTVLADDSKFDMATDFGFEAGLGLVVANKYNIGIRYLNLNTPRFDGTQNLSIIAFPEIVTPENKILGESRSVSMFVIILGIEI